MSDLKNIKKEVVVDKLERMSKAWIINVDRRTKHVLLQAIKLLVGDKYNMRIGKKGKVIVDKHKILIEGFSFKYENDAWKQAELAALSWAKKRIEDEIRMVTNEE